MGKVTQVSLNFWPTTASAVALIFRIFQVIFKRSMLARQCSVYRARINFRALSLQFIFSLKVFFYINYLKVTLLSIFNKSVSAIIYLTVYIYCTFIAQLSLVQLALVTAFIWNFHNWKFIPSNLLISLVYNCVWHV